MKIKDIEIVCTLQILSGTKLNKPLGDTVGQYLCCWESQDEDSEYKTLCHRIT